MPRRKKERIHAQTVRLYWRATMRHKKLFWLSILQPVAALGIGTVVPFFASQTLASSLHHTGAFWHNMLWLCIAIVVSVVLDRIGFLAFTKLQAHVAYDLQHDVVVAVLNRGLRFHNNIVGGKLVSDAIDFPDVYLALSSVVMTSGGPLLLSVIFGLIIIAVGSWQLGLYLLFLVVITLIWAYRESTKRYSLRNTRLQASKALISHISDSIVNAATVKTFAAEARETHASDSLGRTLRELRVHDWQRATVNGSNRMGFLLGGLAGLLLFVYLFSSNDTTSLGVGIFAFSYTMSLVMRLFDINTITRNVEEAFLKASPMAQILSEEYEVKDADDAEALKVKQGSIDFNNVSFSYTEKHSNQTVFSKLNLHIKPGEKVGLVGPSGGGKTTLTRLLLRFDDVQDGSIEVDGHDIREVTQTSLRDAVGYVPQEPLLFHRTILENISYGRPTASVTAVKKAAHLAYADEFITRLPNEFDTIVGERGVKLSGGQRQRVAIARAILKNAPILVLDEATSALDSESEKLIQDAMWELLRGKTAVIIAHRLSTIQRMDRIIVLDDGKIVEEGTHDALLSKKNGTYARLWKHQSGGFLQES